MERIKNYGYEKEALIGAGSMGSVYRAHDFLEDREVALKILHANLENDPEVKERFLREARIASTLHHPNIAEVYECDESNGLPFLSMELLTGVDLRDYIRQKRPLTLAEKVELIAQVCDGLGAAHRLPVVHRDIKPSNIFIHEENATQKRTAKLLDFGIVRLPDSTLTVSGSVLGTPKYMAPEQIARGHCDARSDLFSLTMVLYEFLAGVHPFQGTIIPRRILEEEPDRLRVHNPLIPPALEELVYVGLNKDPARRFTSAEKFAGDLRSFLRELELGRSASGLRWEKKLQSALPVSLDEGTAIQSPEGKMKAFISLVKEFEREIAAENVEAAQRTMVRMRNLAGDEPTLAPGLKQCEGELAVVLKRAVPAAMAASAGQGSSAVVTLDKSGPTAVFTTQVLPTVQSWDDTIGVSGRSGAAGSQATAGAGIQISESQRLDCPACGIANRDSAKFCRECGATLIAAEVDAGARNGEPVAVETEQRSVGIGEGGRKVLASAFQKTKHFVVQVLHLPTPQKLVVAVALLVAVAVAAVPFYVDLWTPVPVERSIGTAVVTAAETHLLASQDPNSKQLMKLAQGTQVNLLDPFTTLSDGYLRVQFVSPKKNSKPGFVRTADLGRWASDDAASAWTILQLSRPGQNAAETDLRKFVEELRKYRSAFAKTPQSEAASLEMAKLYVSLAAQGQKDGKPPESWKGDAEKAAEAISASGSGSQNEIASLNQQLEEMNKPEVAAAPAAVISPREAEYRMYDAKAKSCFNVIGDLDCVLEQAKLMERINPGAAQWWRDQATKARQDFRKGKK